MKVHQGTASLVLVEGEKKAWLRLLNADGRWQWQASRRFEDAEVLCMGGAPTWAEAYRAGMRAAERLFRREAP